MSPGLRRRLDEVVHERVDAPRAGVAEDARSRACGRSSAASMPARIASSMSWLMYATRSTMRTIFPSSVSGSSGPVCLRIPSRTSSVRLSPRPSRSSVSTTRSECSLCRKPSRAALAQQLVERLLARVAERRMAEIVAEPDRLDEILVQPERPRDAARDARRLERVREPRAEVVALGVDEDLRLVPQPAERLRVDDAVAVALERRAQPALVLCVRAAAALVRANGERRQPALLVLAHEALEGVSNPTGKFRHPVQSA